MRLGDMFPDFSVNDSANAGYGEAVFARENGPISVGFASAANVSNILLGKLGHAVSDAFVWFPKTHVYRVSLVFRLRAVFQVISAIVCLYPVFVVDLHTSQPCSNERGGNQWVNCSCKVVRIPLFVERNQDVSIPGLMRLSDAHPVFVQASDSAKVADFVVLESANGFPLFFHAAIVAGSGAMWT